MAQQLSAGTINVGSIIILIVLGLLIIAGVVAVNEGQRRISVQYAKRVTGRKVYGGQSTHIPLKVNQAGVIPIIFAMSILLFPVQIARFIDHPWARAIESSLSFGTVLNSVLYALLIIFFTYFYTAIVFNPMDVADNLKKYGGFVPGLRPGRTHRGIYQPSIDPAHPGWCNIFSFDCYSAELYDCPDQYPDPIFWGNCLVDCGWCCSGDNETV